MRTRRLSQKCQHNRCYYDRPCFYQHETQHTPVKRIPNPFWGALKTVLLVIILAFVSVAGLWVYVQLGGAK